MSAESFTPYIGDTATVRNLLDAKLRSITGVTGLLLAGADGRRSPTSSSRTGPTRPPRCARRRCRSASDSPTSSARAG